MDANLIEAKKALQRAEARFNAGDVLGAVNLALKAKRLFPNLHGITAHLESYRIHSAFDPKSPNTTDWYALLNVDRSFDLETIRKRFKDLRALTHPDKNSSSAADGAFKLVYKAWEAIWKDLGSSSSSGGKSDEKEEEQRSSAAPEKGKCPDCGRQCAYIDSRSTVLECRRCKLIGMRSGKGEGIVMVIRDGFASIDIDGGFNTNINVRGGDTAVNGVRGVHVYGGESILLNRCKEVELKGGESIHMSNCAQININGSGNIGFG